MRFVAEVKIGLKKGITDPEGASTKKALELLGFKEVLNVSAAKIFEISLDAKDEKKAKEEVEKMCQRLLANPVIHKYSIEVKRET